MYFIRPPYFYRWLFPKALFRMNTREKSVYLTFDDGPHPKATPFVLEILREEGVSATFFLLGKNAEAHPELMERILAEGHAIGNHGYAHLNGWNTSKQEYLLNFQKAVPLLGQRLFRPPYGKLGLGQYGALSPQTTIVFWDVISGDFDTTITREQCTKNVLNSIRNGSIIVMHDSAKALPNLQNSLKETIRSMKSQGFGFKKL